MIKGATYSLSRTICVALFFIVAACVFVGCSKPDEQPTPVVPPPNPPPSTIPSGVIEYFTVDTNLVGYNRTTIAKWLVSGTNSLTRTTLSGDAVPNYGSRNTGLLTKDTVFTLAVNNGVQKTQKIFVADPVTTLLWNDTKVAIKTRSEIFVTGTGWKDTALSNPDYRIFFGLNGRTTLITIGTPSPHDGGAFTTTPYIPPNVANNTPEQLATFTWSGVTYTIVSIDATLLVVTYKGPNRSGVIVDWRDTYKFM